MTQVYDSDGRKLAVTVIQAGPCVVVQKKNVETDGYNAVKVGFQEQKEQRLTRPALQEFKKADATPCRWLREFRMESGDEHNEGDTVRVDLFEGVGFVDVTGVSKGRGFQGAMKRHGFGGGRMSHGAGAKRKPGAIGQCAYPARVAKGKKMPGHMGSRKVTQQNLRVVGIRAEDDLLLVEGAIPGSAGGMVLVKKSLKKGERK